MRFAGHSLNEHRAYTYCLFPCADQGIRMQPVLDGDTLPLKTQVCSLGMLLDSSLSLDGQVLAVARNAFAHLNASYIISGEM